MLRLLPWLCLVVAACAPDLDRFQVVGEGRDAALPDGSSGRDGGAPLDGGAVDDGGPLASCDLSVPTLAVLTPSIRFGGRVKLYELREDSVRPCRPVPEGDPLLSSHHTLTWLDDSHLMVGADAVFERVNALNGRRLEKFGQSIPYEGVSNATTLVVDGVRWGVFPIRDQFAIPNIARLALTNAETEELRHVEAADVGLGPHAFGCTTNPDDPSGLLCIRGPDDLTSSAAAEVWPFDGGRAQNEWFGHPTGGVELTHIDSLVVEGEARFIWIGRTDGGEDEIYYSGGTSFLGPVSCALEACQSPLELFDVAPDPFHANGYIGICRKSSNASVLFRGRSTSAACEFIAESEPNTFLADVAVLVP